MVFGGAEGEAVTDPEASMMGGEVVGGRGGEGDEGDVDEPSGELTARYARDIFVNQQQSPLPSDNVLCKPTAACLNNTPDSTTSPRQQAFNWLETLSQKRGWTAWGRLRTGQGGQRECAGVPIGSDSEIR